MEFEEVFGQIIDAKNKQTEKMTVTLGTVTEVRDNDCDVTREQMPELLEVRYHAIIDNLENYIKIIPKQGSKVLCAIIENDISETCIIAYSEIERVMIKIEGAEFIMENGKFTIKNGKADLKDILKTGFETLKRATITTPSGPGQFSPDDKLVFERQKSKVLELFN
ncbi:hypothetical protein [Flagellimonas onchidii]|uniref:hypothetical protein n=1 Tax=Flagellimonas onchidii TaxID=2562684 RepID=UPI0010A5DAEF|nr:hypothetical protein [Allomuricauda onchidii]